MKNSQEKLLNLLKNRKFININIEFEKLSDELSLINQRAKNQEQEANVRFSNAQKLRVRIIVGSILLSTLVAAILARYTSMAIARPIKAVTNVAQKITQESNFNLRASVTINNEVGTLATSLNQLVQWIGNYTTELELAHQTLEKRVEERTLELQQALQDLKETQSQLIQTEKMSSLGEMVAGIAHEINNPVNFIYANIEYANNYFQDLLSLVTLYKEQYPSFNTAIEKKLKEIDWEYLNEDLLKLLSSIKIGAERIREIVLSLRNFSRLDEADMKEVNIHEGINNTLLILNHRLKQNIEVIKDYGELPLVECYPAQLNQVFMNIISNAIDALLETNTSANKKIIICTQNINNKYIRIGIKDNGSGIPEEIRNKLFNPFFTTKPVGKGTGLGLSISYKIIEKHYGKIEVISEIGKGTEFAIMIPIKT